MDAVCGNSAKAMLKNVLKGLQNSAKCKYPHPLAACGNAVKNSEYRTQYLKFPPLDYTISLVYILQRWVYKD